MPLLNLTKKVADSFGLAHKINLEVLRHYIKTTSEEKLIEEIKEIKDASYFRFLWEAGLSAGLQQVVLQQLKIIK
ncbi:MAG: hypothetical protein KKD77_22700 [Gammaproteobacteria bacterium]|nr:hypothetical protein [Gammaproteobacteria bacterium]